MEILKLRIDVAFKSYFVKNPKQLRQFVSVMLDIPIEDITKIKILNPEIPPVYAEDKFSRLDLLLSVGEKMINLEMQVCAEDDYTERSVFYWARMCSSGVERGHEYAELKECIAINILGFNMFACEEYHSEFTFMEKTRHEILSDKAQIHYFELKKLGKNEEDEDRKKLWLKLIGAETEEELEMLTKTKVAEIEDAVVILKEMSYDERLRMEAQMREDALREKASFMNAARRAEERGMKKGIEKGRAEGIEKGRAEGIEKGRAEGIEKGRAEGIEKGRAEGIEKGRAEGIEKGRAEIIGRLKALGMTDKQLEKILSNDDNY